MKRLVTIICRSSSTTTVGQSFHKRQLPSNLIALSSPNGKVLFKEALATNGMESYFPLAEQFVTQSDPSFCSLSSLTMVLNALNFDPKKVWKGLWRWVSEEMLQCESTRICGHSLERIKTEGLSFTEFESLARCHGVKITSHRVIKDEEGHIHDETSSDGIEAFRSLVERISSDDRAETFIVVNYGRKTLGQTGDGHYSPIGGYHKEKGLVLVMDVARFKYPPYWVSLQQLWEAMAEPDSHTKEPRGYFVVSGWQSKPTQSVAGEELAQQQHWQWHTHSHNHNHNHEHGHEHAEHSAVHVASFQQRSGEHVRVGAAAAGTTNSSTSTACTHDHSHHSHAHCHHHSHSHAEHARPHVSTTIANGSHLHHLGLSNSSSASTSTTLPPSTSSTTSTTPTTAPQPKVCPPMIRTWQDFKRYVPRNMCQSKGPKGETITTEPTTGPTRCT